MSLRNCAAFDGQLAGADPQRASTDCSLASSASTARHLRQISLSGARNAKRPKGSLPSGGPAAGGTGSGAASVAVEEGGVSAARRTAFGPRPRSRSSFASTALIVKNVAGAWMVSAPAGAISAGSACPRSDANATEVVAPVSETSMAAANVRMPCRRCAKRDFIDRPHISGRRRRLCAPDRHPDLFIGSQRARGRA